MSTHSSSSSASTSSASSGTIKALYERATILHRQHKFQDALKVYLHVVEMSPIHHKAHFKLATLYEKGISLYHTPDQNRLLEQAVHHYEKAAELGYDVAQFNLGVMLMRGSGTQQNEDAAVKWLRRAADNGSKRAALVLDKILTEQRAKKRLQNTSPEQPSSPNSERPSQEPVETDEQLFDRLKSIKLTNPFTNSSLNTTPLPLQHPIKSRFSPSHADDTNSLDEDEQTYNTAVDLHTNQQHTAATPPSENGDDVDLFMQDMNLPDLPLPKLPTASNAPTNSTQAEKPEDSHSRHSSQDNAHDYDDDRELDELDSLSSTDIVNRLLTSGPADDNTSAPHEKTPKKVDPPQSQFTTQSQIGQSPLERERRKNDTATNRILDLNDSDDDEHSLDISSNDDDSTTHNRETGNTLSLHDDDTHSSDDTSDAGTHSSSHRSSALATPNHILQEDNTHKPTRHSPLTMNSTTAKTSQLHDGPNSPRLTSPLVPSSARAIRRRDELAEIQELEHELQDAKNEVKEKHTAIKLLGEDKKREEQHLKRKQGKIIRLDTKVKSLELKLLEHEQEQDQMQEEHKQQIKKLREHYEMELQEREEMIASLASENDVVQSTVEKHFQTMRETHNQQLEEKMNIIREHESTIHRLQNQVKSFHHEHNEADEDFVRKMQTAQSKFEKVLQNREEYFKGELDDLTKQLDDAKLFHEQEVSALKEEMERTNIEHVHQVRELKHRIETMREEIRVLKQGHHEEVLRRETVLKNGFQEEKRELMERITSAEQHVDDRVRQKMEEIHEKHQQQYERLAEEHQENIATLTMEHKQTLQKIEAQLRRLQKENSELKNNDALSKKVSEQEQLIAQLRANEKEAQRVISNISRQNFSFIETIELNAQNEMKFVEKIALQEKKIRLLESKSRQLEAHVEHLKAETNSLPSQEEVEKVKFQSEKLQQIMIQQFDKIQEYKDRVEDLEEQLQEYEIQMKEMASQLERQKETAVESSASKRNSLLSEDGDTFSTTLVDDDNNGRSEAFEDEYNQMMEMLRKGEGGVHWEGIIQRLKTLKREYQLNLQRHRKQMHDVISFMQSLR